MLKIYFGSVRVSFNFGSVCFGFVIQFGFELQNGLGYWVYKSGRPNNLDQINCSGYS